MLINFASDEMVPVSRPVSAHSPVVGDDRRHLVAYEGPGPFQAVQLLRTQPVPEKERRLSCDTEDVHLDASPPLHWQDRSAARRQPPCAARTGGLSH